MVWPFSRKTRRSSSTAGRATAPLVRARYDAAQTTAENMRHWAMADPFSADASMALGVRKQLRERARYEVSNNSYAKGMVLTLANDCVGTGPRLQMLTDNNDLNNTIEAAFEEWAHTIDLAQKLRVMRASKCTDGEVFGLLVGNSAHASPVQLDYQLIECDRVTSREMVVVGDTDGINLDAYGNPSSYSILRQHPGALNGGSLAGEYDIVPARQVIHWYRMDRPGQHRGIPEITPSIELFGQLRRYTLAVIAAAETAADFAAVLQTDAPAGGEAQAVDPLDIVKLEKRMATVLPEGWELGQVSAQQPTTTYGEFKREILNEIARCMNLPFNVAAGNSSGYNYASGRLDHQTYYKSVRVEQAHLSRVVLDRLLAAWLEEARIVYSLPPLKHAPHTWFWDGTEHVDPAKEANAQSTRLANYTTTLAAEYAKQGKDWEVEVAQIAKEKKYIEQLGLVFVRQSDILDSGKTENGEESTTIDADDLAGL